MVKVLTRTFDALCIFKYFKEDSVLQPLQRLLKALEEKKEIGYILSCYNDYAYELLKEDSYFSLKHYISEKILYDMHLFAQIVEKKKGDYPSVFIEGARKELVLLQNIAHISSKLIKTMMLERGEGETTQNMIKGLLDWDNEKCIEALFEADWENIVEPLIAFYEKNGCGEMAKYYAFVWTKEGTLRGIDTPDPIKLKNLVSYEHQKADVVGNRLKFLKGYPANNLLLYGARGTGKSSLVKAIINEYYCKGLRLIEIRKDQLVEFEKLIPLVKNKKQKFILFVDDLAFEDNEDTYTSLKTILEGGIQNRPSNVLIYATSNRRHLVKERLSDRVGLGSTNVNDEVHARDLIEEKLSLADRFGMTISFSTPTQEEYLEIVYQMAESRALAIDKETLRRKALQWEIWHNGRSGRTAKQFINDLEY